MRTAREKRLRILEQYLEVRQKPPLPLIFYDSVSYKDEPNDLIVSASMNDMTWERGKEESVPEFQKRIGQDVRANPNGKVGIIWLKRNRTGLPEPDGNMPAYTPYAEVIKNLQTLDILKL